MTGPATLGGAEVLKLAITLSLIIAAGLAAPATARAQSGDWEATGLSDPVTQLFAPASGAFFARTEGGLLRSDDGGASWAAVVLPPELPPTQIQRVAVGPIDHTVVYIFGGEGLYRTSDDAASWSLVLPTRGGARALALSPTDPNLVYLGLAGSRDISSDFRFMRSLDGGASWEQLEEHHNSLCGWGVRILQPHAIDPARVIRVASCYAGRNFNDTAYQSLDQGASWSPWYNPAREPLFPDRLVGGQGGNAVRYYLAGNRDGRFGGSSVLRTDDDGASWEEVLGFRGGVPMQQPELPSVRVGGLAYDPVNPDRVYVGLNESMGQDGAPNGRVEASADGGANWAVLGGTDIGKVNDLTLGIDARNLYVATDRGLLRLSLE